MRKDRSKRVSSEEKLRVVSKALSRGNISQVASEEGMSRDTIYRWSKELRAAAIGFWKGRSSGRSSEALPPSVVEEIKRLKAELKQLEEEKKLAEVAEEYYRLKLGWLKEDIKKNRG